MQSAWMYSIYFSLPVEIVYSSTGKPVKATRNDALHSLWMLLHTFVFNTLFLSFLCHTDYLPFGSTAAERFDERPSLLDYLDPKHLGNCFFLGLWFQQVLVWGAAVVEFVVQVLIGWKCTPMIDSPLYSTTKPSGTNLLVGLLQSSAYRAHTLMTFVDAPRLLVQTMEYSCSFTVESMSAAICA